MNRWIVLLGLTVSLPLPAIASDLTPDGINASVFSGKAPKEGGANPLSVKLQVLLDRARFSPGEIDGQYGENVEKALQAFTEANGLPAGKVLTTEIWSKLQQKSAEPVIGEYTVTEKDVKGPYLEKLPAKMEDKKSLKRLDYANPKEALGERFHMSPDLLTALNPGQKFDHAGDKIAVINLIRDKQPPKVAHIEVDKSRQTLKAFAKDGALVGFYPASVGSEEKPTPSGMLKVVSIQSDPTYRYDPKYKFKGVASTEPFTINPGPNNPVGSTWIGLSEAGYGIHGTEEPSRVSKSESHGCVRLTNWDVERLGKLVKKGVEVTFTEGKQALR